MLRAKTLLAVIGVMLILVSPGFAETIFTFNFADLDTLWTSGSSTFTTSVNPLTSGSVTRTVPPMQKAEFDTGAWAGSEGFAMSMTISDVTATTANATGTFSVTDIDGDAITGTVDGVWERKTGSFLVFDGALNDVVWDKHAAGNDTFNGHSGDAVNMLFDWPSPWTGWIIQLNTAGPWFTEETGPDGSRGWAASVDAGVAGAIPAPGAVVMGLIGLTMVGSIRRRFA